MEKSETPPSLPLYEQPGHLLAAAATSAVSQHVDALRDECMCAANSRR